MARSRTWCYTLHDYTEEMEATLSKIETIYHVYGRETCPTTGRKHLQGFLRLKTAKSLKAVKKLLNSQQVHLEIAKGSDEQNRTYCTKDGDFWEQGQMSSQGKRSDLESYHQAVLDGMSENQLRENFTSIWTRYPNLTKRIKSTLTTPISPSFSKESFQWILEYPDNKSLILWGEPGIGKTEFAKTLLGDNFYLVSHLDQLNNFVPDFHSGIIFDDMSFLHLPREAQIHIVDQDNDRAIHIRYGIGFIPKQTKKIFTTNIANGHIFDLNDGAIKRRVYPRELIKFFP